MIRLTDAKNPYNKGRKVTYQGTGREYLKNSDLFLTGNIAQMSDSLEVEDFKGTRYWVGHRYLDLVVPSIWRTTANITTPGAYVTAISELEKRRSLLQSELEKVDSAIETLKGL